MQPGEYRKDLATVLAEREAADGIKRSVIPANDFVLQLDFDSKEAWDRFMDPENKVMKVLRSVALVRDIITTRSAGGGRHVYISLNKPVVSFVRIALQAALGSDPTREALCILQEIGQLPKQPCNICLFETGMFSGEAGVFVNTAESDGVKRVLGRR